MTVGPIKYLKWKNKNMPYLLTAGAIQISVDPLPHRLPRTPVFCHLGACSNLTQVLINFWSCHLNLGLPKTGGSLRSLFLCALTLWYFALFCKTFKNFHSCALQAYRRRRRNFKQVSYPKSFPFDIN